MKFLHANAITKQVTDQIELDEYCDSTLKLPMDGALAKINGPFGPKINKTFSELFFVVSGRLEIEVDGIVHELNARDMYIVQPGVKHKISSSGCEVFISCAPQFNPDQIEYCT